MFILNKIKPISTEFIIGDKSKYNPNPNVPIVFNHYMYAKRAVSHMYPSLKTVDIQGDFVNARLMRPHGEKLSFYGQTIKSVPVNLNKSRELVRCL